MNAPDLDDFLVGKRTGKCEVCRTVKPEHLAPIKAKVDEGLHAWKAYQAYLVACGYTNLSKSMVEYHFSLDAGHKGNDD